MRPTIYIGLGGTGIRAIAQTKKMYEDAYGVGNIPPCIAFLVVDSDMSILDDKTLATSVEADFVEGFETQTIAERIDRCWSQVFAIKGVNHYIIDVHIVLSLADGVGYIVNLVDIIRYRYRDYAHVIGYGVLHSEPFAMTRSRKDYLCTAVNAYAAVKDLDYIMSASNNNPIQFTNNGVIRKYNLPIFDEFFVVDNHTEHGHVLTDIGQVCEVLGISLFASGDDMGSKVRTMLDNSSWTFGGYNVNNKKGWVQSLGACKVVYKGEQLAQIYGYKAAMELIRSIRQEGADAQQYAQQWIEEAGVREDGEQYNMLIDSIVEPKTIERLRVPALGLFRAIDEIKSDVANYICDMSDMPSDACIKKMMEEKKQSLVAKVRQLLSQEKGVGNSHIYLDSLIRLCEKYRMEMVNEAEQNKATLQSKSALLEKAIKEYEEYCDRLFKTRSGKEERLEIVSKFAKDIRKINYEIKRREIARDIFIYLVKEARELSHKIDTLDEQLGSLCADYTQSIERLQNAENSMFEYDLSVDERMNMTLKYDFSIAELVDSLPVSLLDLDIEKQLRPAIEQYVATLPQAVKYREENITDVIEALSNEDYEELKYQINVRSSRLLRIDDRGQMCSRTGRTPSEQMYRGYFYSIYSPKGNEQVHEQTRLERNVAGYYDRPFREFVLTNAESLRQQMIVLSVGSAIIPYCIEVLNEDVVEEYERQVANANMGGATFNPHFDKNIYEQMKAQNFSLKPEC